MRLFLLLGFLAQLIAGQDCGPVCELDAFGRRLTYPNPIVAATLYATTINVNTYRDLKGAYIVQTSTYTTEAPPKPTITWEVSGVKLTYPTTYAIYTKFVHSKLISGSECATQSSNLKLGPSTNYESLIYPASEIDGTLPPSGLINYLQGIPTVYAQLGGSVNSSCDPTSTTPFASAPTATLTTTDFLPSATVSTQTVTVSAAFETISGSQLTLPVTTPRFRNTTTTVPVPGPSSTITSTSTVLSITSITSSFSASSSSSAASSSSSSKSSTSFSSASSIPSSTSFSSASSIPSSTTILTKTSSFPTTSTTTSTSSIKLPTGSTVASTTVTFSGAISSIEKTSPLLPSITGTGGIGGVSAASNFSAPSTPTSSIQEVTTNLANRFADAAYMGTGGWLASILGLAIYWF